MPQISNCPRCGLSIAIPTTPTENAVVECPHCRERFDLSETLDFVADADHGALPPALIVISAGSDGGPGAADSTLEPGGAPASGDKPREGNSVEVRCPCCRQAFALETLLLAETDEPLGQKAAAAIAARAAGAEVETGPQLRFGGDAGREDHAEFRLQLGDQERTPAPAAAFEFGAPVGSGGKTGGGEAKGTATRRRPRRERGGLKDFIGAILGGAAGLLITYYMLNLIGGRRFDFLQVYLPGVKHTAAHRPDWLGGPTQEPEEEVDSEPIKSAAPEVTPPARVEPPKPAGDSEEPKPPAEKEPPQAASGATDAKTLPSDYVGLIHPPEVTPDMLGASLKAVADLMKAGGLTEEAYAAWCRLAEAVTFVDRSGGGPQIQNRLDAVRRLLRDLKAEDFAKIGQWAGARLADSGRPTGGILLAGFANKPNTPRGNGYLMGLQVEGTGERVVVASPATLPLVQDDRLLLLGQIVDQPKESIQGLDTELPQVVWSGTVLKCSK